jgi:hypothetical protein
MTSLFTPMPPSKISACLPGSRRIRPPVSLHVRVFSDDPAWCRQHLKLGDASVCVDVNDGANSYLSERAIGVITGEVGASKTVSVRTVLASLDTRGTSSSTCPTR